MWGDAIDLDSSDQRATRHVWTYDEDVIMRNMWGKFKVKEVAKLLGKTRNAVCGRAKRLGLCQRRTKRVKFIPLAKQAARVSAMKDDAKGDERKFGNAAKGDAGNAGLYNIVDLNSQMCHWPVKSEGSHHFFCGAETVFRSPYCAGHSRAAYTALSSYRPRNTFPHWR